MFKDILDKVKENLKEFNQEEVISYINYLAKLESEEKEDKQTKKKTKSNPWIQYRKVEDLSEAFKLVKKNWLQFDWKHITMQSTWVSFDYIAYKNKMLLVYPESILDIQLVYEWEDISFWKENWKIAYKHIMWNPFLQTEDRIIWWYCVIKNKRWEFLTILNKDEIDKHRKVAKTDSIWKNWLKEMSLKTIIKKSVKIHFDDIYSEIIEIDNEENDLENNPINLELSWKSEVDIIETLDDLKKYWEENKWKWVEFARYVVKKRKELETKNI